MKSLLTAIKERLTEAITLGRPQDIFITVDQQFIPPALMFPAIAIKDGDSQELFTEEGDHFGTVRKVEIYVYAQVLKPEAPIMGDKGVLALAQAVADALTGHDLGLGYWRALPIGQGASELFGDESRMAQSKTLIFEYTK